MSMEFSKKYTVVDLFSGAGGLSYGFLTTGRFEIKVAYENNIYAKKTYMKNHPDTVMGDDVCDANFAKLIEEFGDIDVVIGGPPCQGFSNANRQKKYAISQNNILVKQFMRAVVELKPKAFVMENVSMLRSDTHRFYMDENDKKRLKKYNIPMQREDIILLEGKFVFDGAKNIVADAELVRKFLWLEKDYQCLNVIYKTRKNHEKCANALHRHKKNLLLLAEKLLTEHSADYIVKENHRVARVIKDYYLGILSISDVTEAIVSTIMIQRMLGKAYELHSNSIIVDDFLFEQDLVARVKSVTVLEYIENILSSGVEGYRIEKGLLNAVDFGVPQKRERFVLMGIKKDLSKEELLPKPMLKPEQYRTVKDAISDISNMPVIHEVSADNGMLLSKLPSDLGELGRRLRNTTLLYNHIATKSTDKVLERFRSLKQGENFHDLEARLKDTYTNATRTQNTIYLRLKYNDPSGTVVNVRKSMWVHPIHNRALTVREAARLQTFPDSFIFIGTKDSQYQQVGNAVPPILAEAIAARLIKLLDSKV